MAASFGPYHGLLSRIIDGDTVTADILLRPDRVHRVADLDLGFNVHLKPGGLWLVDQHLRFYGCNADEHNTPGGQAAIAWLTTMVKPGDQITIVDHGWDKYGGRIDAAILLADGTDLIAAMIAAGHAARWDGQGPKPAT